MTKGGTKLGALPASDITFRTSMREYSEISFNVYKADCHNINVWDKLVDFRLLWVREWNMLYELQIDLTESSETVKAVQARSLGESELSQINLYGIEINTEDDIARDDYRPTVLYVKKEDDVTKEYDSLLNRIMEKVPHYEIDEVDASIANIQRTFTFDGTSIYDAFQEIAEEIQCLFIIDCSIDGKGKISRKIKVKDLLSHCNGENCKERGDFIDKCSKCGGTDITLGYGTDTAVFVSKDNLADEITYTTDCDKVKNCFRLEAGDDLMTATIANCNPNGSSYIWYFSDKMKEDMSQDLKKGLNDYDSEYEIYQKTKELLKGFSDYNEKVELYNGISSEKHEKISDPIIGYPNLMQAYYNVVDFRLFLESGLMPSVEMIETSAAEECSKLRSELSSRGVAVQTVSLTSKTTVESAVKQFAKTIVDNRYEVEVDSSSYNSNTRKWTGTFKVSNVANEDDTSISSSVTVNVTDDIGTYTQQRIDKLLEKKVTSSDSATDVKALFQRDSSGNFRYGSETVPTFNDQIKKYSLSRLLSFHDACQACLDVMIEQGIADESNACYSTLYYPFYERLGWLAAEIKTRESDIAVVINTEERILKEQTKAQNELNIETCLGSNLWNELMSFRREDTYSNSNYISDGLTNEELFKNAQDFISVAQNEIYKSSTLQHTISSTLKNLLFMREFSPIVDNFEVGNWIRVKIDGKVYRLRLLEYEISFDEPDNIAVTFSDVTETKTGVSDIESILNQASSMASSYDAVARQSRVGKEAKKMIDGWVKDGLSLTNQKIVNNADDQQVTMDSHGLLCREYLPITDTYDDRQLKLINRGLYLTDDNWKTARAGVGNFVYTDPSSKEVVSAYGVIADTIVGKIILSEKVGIYNSNNSVSIDKNGFVITTPKEAPEQSIFTIRHETGENTYNDLFVVNTDGSLKINGYATEGYVSSQISTSATGLTAQFNKSISDTKTSLTTDYETKISASATQISAQVSAVKTDMNNIKTNLQSQITQNATDISLKVSQDDLENQVKLSMEGFEIKSSSISWDTPNTTMDKDGNLTITSATVTGSITATSLTLSGCNLTTSDIKAKNNNTLQSELYGTGNTLLFYKAGNAISKIGTGTASSETNSNSGTCFAVNKDGLLTASNAVIYGNIYASGGTIGGFTLDSNSLYYNLPTNKTNYGVNIGNCYHPNADTFLLYPNNTAADKWYVAGTAITNPALIIGDKFAVGTDGTVYASGLQITYDCITDPPDFVAINSEIKQNPNDNAPSAESHDNKYFKVDNQGQLIAANVDIYGKITASNGKIGKLNIESDGLFYRYETDTTNDVLGLSPVVGIYSSNQTKVQGTNKIKNRVNFLLSNSFFYAGNTVVEGTDALGTITSVVPMDPNFIVSTEVEYPWCILGGWNIGKGLIKTSVYNTDNKTNFVSDRYHDSYTICRRDSDSTNGSLEVGIKCTPGNNTYANFYVSKKANNSTSWQNTFYVTNAGMISAASDNIKIGPGASRISTFSNDNAITLYDTKTKGTGNNAVTKEIEIGLKSKIDVNNQNKYDEETWKCIYLKRGTGSIASASTDVFYVTNAGDVYNTNGTIQKSDSRLKNTISDVNEKYEIFFKKLRAVTYKFNDGTSNRFHSGFIAQEVESALIESGLSTLDFAGFIRDTSSDTKTLEGGSLGLRYGEFISLNTHMIQIALKENEKLKERISQLEEKILTLTA